MEKFKSYITQNKKIVISVAIILLFLILGGIYFAGQSNNNVNEPKQTEQKQEKIEQEIKLEEIKPLEDKKVVVGVKDYKIEKDTKVDLEKLVSVNSDIVEKVEIDDSKVDYSKEGEYEVIYTITLNGDNLNKFLEQNKDVKLSFNTNADVIIVKVKITVTVISEEEAKKETEKGNTDVVTEETKETISKDNQQETQNKPSSGNGGSSDNVISGSGDSGNGGNSNNNGGNSSSDNKPETPTHKHNYNVWVEPVMGTREVPYTVDVPYTVEVPVYEYVGWYECKKCGAKFDTDKEALKHGFECNSNYTAKEEKVQTGTKTETHYKQETRYKTETYEKTPGYYKCSCGKSQ